MSEEVKEVEMTEKEITKTALLKSHLQKIVYQVLGEKVSKEKAWDLFKAIQHGMVEFTLHAEGNQVPLAGVGTFEILKTKARGFKAGCDKNGNPLEGIEQVWPFNPRFKFYPSSAIAKRIEQEMGLADHNLKLKHFGIYATEEELEAEAKAVKPVKASKPAKPKKEAKASKSDKSDSVEEEL